MNDLVPMSVKFPPLQMVALDVELEASTKEKVAKTQCWVEASDDECTRLWEDLAIDENTERGAEGGKRVKWSDHGIAQITIGTYGVYPLTIVIRWAIVDGILVGFFGSDAPVVHFLMMEHFLTLNSLSYRCGLHRYAESFRFSFRHNNIHEEIKRFDYAQSLTVLAKRKQEQEENGTPCKETKTQ